MNGDDTHIVEVEAEEYDDSYMGDGVNSVPSVAFERQMPDPDAEEGDAPDDRTMSVKVFELPAHRIVYIRLIDEPHEDEPLSLPDAIALSAAAEANHNEG